MKSFAKTIGDHKEGCSLAQSDHSAASLNDNARASSEQPPIRRKSSCACGGGCPACQAKSNDLKISQPNDPAEIEADAIADRIMRMPAGDVMPPIHSTNPTNRIRRKCDACEEKDDEPLVQRKSLPASDGILSRSPSHVRDAISSGGRPLDLQTRGFFEPKFGYDLSNVRIHTGRTAAESASSINARAYTLGQDIVFSTGEYRPDTDSGKHLIAHELAHVVQRSPDVQCMSLGHGKPPTDKLIEVPQEELERVQAAIAKVRAVAKNAGAFAACHKSYAEGCPGGNASSLEQAFDKTILWRLKPGERSGAAASTICNTENVGYSDLGFGGGVESLAFDLLHELGHVCGISCVDKPHHLADKLTLYCMGPQEANINNQLAVGLGLSTEDKALIFSYGWLLKESRSGRVGMRLNADINLLAGLQAIKEAVGEEAPAGEIAGLGLDWRLRPFSGERFGGLSFHAGLGAQVGRFVVRPPIADDPADIRYDAAAVVTLGGRIEWWVKDEEKVDSSGEPGRVKPRALDFSYRAIQPVTTGARRTHEFLLSYIFHM